MADLNIHGQAPSQGPDATEPKKTVVVDKKVVDGPPQEAKNMMELIPARNGNEMVILVKMLESINKNLAFLANTIHAHLNPEKKNG